MLVNLIYTAGLIDGEGTITLSKHGRASKFRNPVVSVSSTSIELLEFLKTNFGGSIVTQKVYQKNYKQSWSWKLSNDSALLFMKRVRPFMKEEKKCKRIDLLCSSYKESTQRNGKYTNEQLQRKIELEESFFLL